MYSVVNIGLGIKVALNAYFKRKEIKKNIVSRADQAVQQVMLGTFQQVTGIDQTVLSKVLNLFGGYRKYRNHFQTISIAMSDVFRSFRTTVALGQTSCIRGLSCLFSTK